MNTKICYVISHLHESDDGDLEERDVERHEEHHHEEHKEEKKSKVILKDADYYQYIAKHGHHFNKELADYAISKLDSVNEKICYKKTEDLLTQADDKLSDGSTVADLYFIANTIKSRHSSSTVKSDAHVVSLALEYINDPNKVEGEIFCEWLDSVKRRNEGVRWAEFI